MKKLRWQPETAVTMIYWSFTLGIFFVAMIFTLEKTHLYTTSYIILTFFFLFAYLGWNRYLVVGDTLRIKALLWFHSHTWQPAQVQEIIVAQNHILILADRNFQLMMRKKTCQEFVAAVQNSPFRDVLTIVTELPEN